MANPSNGTVKQDKYFVQPGETFTLSFEPKDEGAVVTKLVINGEEVEIDPEATSYSVTSTVADMGWQVKEVVFSTVNDYLKNGILDYYNSIEEADIALSSVKDNGGTWEYTAGVTSYVDSNHKVAKVATEAVDKGLKTLAGMTKATTKEKLAKIEEIVEDAEESINEAYSKLVSEAKTSALKNVETEVATLGKTYKSYIDTDDTTSLLSDAKAAINEATTLQEVFEAYDANKASVKVNDTTYTSAYKDLLTKQNTVISTLKSALDSADSILEEKEDLEDLAEQAAIIDALEDFGVSVETLPGEIVKQYTAKALQARSLELNSSNKIALAVEGEKAVKDAASGVTTSLYNGILNKYKAEVSALTSASDELKNTLKSALENAASEWKNRASITDHTIVAGYLGALYDATTGLVTFSYDSNTLLGTLETTLANSGNKDIAKERVSNVLAEYKTKWAAELKEVKENDSDYVDAISTVKNDSGTYVIKEAVLGSTNDEGSAKDEGVANFALKGTGDAKDDSSISRETVTTETRGKSLTQYYSAQAQYDSLVSGYTMASNKWTKGTVGGDTKFISNPGAFTNVTDAKQWASNYDGTISKAYKEFMTKLSSEFSNKVKSQCADGIYIKQKTVTDAFDAKVEDEDGNIILKEAELEEYAKTAYANAKNLKTLNDSIDTFVKKIINNTTSETDPYQGIDTAFTSEYILTGKGKFYEETLDAKNEASAFSRVLAGELSGSELTDYLKDSALYKVYYADVWDYTSKTLENFKIAINSYAYEKALTQKQVDALKDVVSVIEGLFNVEKGYIDFTTAGTKIVKISNDKTKYEEVDGNLLKFCKKLGLTVDISHAIDSDDNTSTFAVYFSIARADGFAKNAVSLALKLSCIETSEWNWKD